VTNRTAATRYARALLDVALAEKADLVTIETQLTTIAQLIEQHEPLRRALLSPSVPVPRKKAAVAEIANRSGVMPVVAKTLALLTENDRLAMLADVTGAFRQKLLDMRNVVRADVTTAAPLSSEQLESIKRSLAAATGRSVDLTSHVDPAIVGGIVARVGSTVFDGSVTGHLNRIRTRLDASI
jgi:F-type H+-transporting ATPase subunit delta